MRGSQVVELFGDNVGIGYERKRARFRFTGPFIVFRLREYRRHVSEASSEFAVSYAA